MHWTGKTLIFLMAIGAAAAFVMTAKLVKNRGTWISELQTIKTSSENNAQELVTKRQERDKARAELQREMLRWNRYWSDVQGSYIPQNNNIIATFGSAAGIVPNQNLFAFQIDPSGKSIFFGPVSVAQVQPNQAALQPAFRVRVDDVPKWNGQSWRFRTMIPSSYVSQISGLQTELLVADELMNKQRGNLQVQSELVNSARQQREDRIGELLGVQKGTAIQPGLVAEIAKADDQRNATLAEVDRLRREIRELKIASQRLIQENNGLADRLMSQRGQKETASR